MLAWHLSLATWQRILMLCSSGDGRVQIQVSVRACGTFTKLLSKQEESHICIADLINDSNLEQTGCDNEQDKDVADGEAESESDNSRSESPL